MLNAGKAVFESKNCENDEMFSLVIVDALNIRAIEHNMLYFVINISVFIHTLKFFAELLLILRKDKYFL